MSNSFKQQIEARFEKGIEAYAKPVEFMTKNAAREVDKERVAAQNITVENIVFDDKVLDTTSPHIDTPKKEDDEFVL